MLNLRAFNKRPLAIALVLLTFVALVLTVGTVYGQNVYQTNILAPLYKAFQDPTVGIIKSFDIEWTAEPRGKHR